MIDYQPAFLENAKRRGLVAPDFAGSKQDLKRKLLEHGQEKDWQALQGYVYGQGIHAAKLYPGVIEFLQLCQSQGWLLFIVSHKTKHGHFDEKKVNLRDAAIGFLKDQGVLDQAQVDLPIENIYFESTQAQKVNRICKLNLDCFVDDLEEILRHESFPSSTRGICFDPYKNSTDDAAMICCRKWQELGSLLVC